MNSVLLPFIYFPSFRTFARSGFPTEGYADAGTKWVK